MRLNSVLFNWDFGKNTYSLLFSMQLLQDSHLEGNACLQQSMMSASGVRRDKAALSSGCKSHPATAPAGSNRSSHGGNEVAEAYG